MIIQNNFCEAILSILIFYIYSQDINLLFANLLLIAELCLFKILPHSAIANYSHILYHLPYLNFDSIQEFLAFSNLLSSLVEGRVEECLFIYLISFSFMFQLNRKYFLFDEILSYFITMFYAHKFLSILILSGPLVRCILLYWFSIIFAIINVCLLAGTVHNNYFVKDLSRKLFHIILLLIVLPALLLDQLDLLKEAIIAITIVFLHIEATFKNPKINHFKSYFMRDGNDSCICYLFLLFGMSHPIIAYQIMRSLIVLAIGDVVASLVGISIGTNFIYSRNLTFEGLLVQHLFLQLSSLALFSQTSYKCALAVQVFEISKDGQFVDNLFSPIIFSIFCKQ